MTSEPIMGLIQEIYKENFNPRMIRARFSQRLVEDVHDENEQLKKIHEVHNYAHRNADENVGQLIKSCYFPRMNKIVRDFVKNCETCKIEKYDRHPQKHKKFKLLYLHTLAKSFILIFLFSIKLLTSFHL